MSSSLRKINRKIATNIVNWAGVPKEHSVTLMDRLPKPQKRLIQVQQKLSLRQRMILLMAKMQQQQKKMAEAAEVNNAENLRDLIESEDLTPEALQARKEADEAAKAEVSAPEGQ